MGTIAGELHMLSWFRATRKSALNHFDIPCVCVDGRLETATVFRN
jgi:hypothetical protein